MTGRDLAQNINYRKGHQISIIIYYVIVFLFYVAWFSEWVGVSGVPWFYYVFSLFFSIGFFKFYFKALKDLYYSFWGFTILIFVYIFYCLLKSLTFGHYHLPFLLHLLTLHFIALIAYFMNSPMYYPVFNWWEYDFRFRSDLKAQFLFQNYVFDCRISDLRRKAACMVLFEKYPIPTNGKIKCQILQEAYEFDVILTSISDAVPGRGHSYGVKFILQNHEQENKLEKLMSEWREEAKRKQSEKFRLSS